MMNSNNLPITASLCFLLLCGDIPCHGFGKNKVQYASLKWHYNALPHFESHHHQNQGELPTVTARWIENAYCELSHDFGFTHRKPIPLLVYGSPTLFEQTNVLLEVIPEGVGGFTEILKNRIVVPFDGSYAEFRHVLHHELVHAFQFGIIFDQIGGSLLRGAAVQMPLWFAEGSAEYLSCGWNTKADMFLMDRTIHGSIPLPGPEMGGYLVYKGGQSFLHFLATSRGDSTFHRFLAEFRKTKRVVASIEKVYCMKLPDLGKEWHQELKRIYWPEIGRRQKPDAVGKELTSQARTHTKVNLRPRISPDGSRIAYYTDARDFTRILVVDTSGEKICETGQFRLGDQFESFQPFRSGMCWSPDGDRLAFIAKKAGKNEIRIISIPDGKPLRKLTPDLLSISSPDWSPDGSSIVFRGLRRDHADLYLYDLKSDELDQLTADIRGECNPRFSPDGGSIVFSARDTSGIASRGRVHERMPADLFLLDLKDRAVVQVTSTPWNEEQPSFSPDGARIVYVSDRNGIDNLYVARLDSVDGSRALTDIIGGCSTPDWSREHDRLVFCLFQKQVWSIRLCQDPLGHLADSLPVPTVWVSSLADTSAHFFAPVPSPPAQADSTDSVSLAHGIHSPDSTATDSADTVAVAKGTPDSSGDSTVPDTAGESGQADGIARSYLDSAAVFTIRDTQGERVMDPDSDHCPPEINMPLPAKPYRVRFTPDMVSVGIAINTLYGYAGQGVVMFSDILGNHRITLAADIHGTLDEYHVFTAYLNSRYRFDFGVGVLYNRYYSFTPLTIDVSQEDSLSTQYDLLFHDTNIGFMLPVTYSFSTFSRTDLTLYYRRTDRLPYRLVGSKPERDPDRPATSLNIMLPSCSYVFDNTIWGLTGPVNGLRAKASLCLAPALQSGDPSFVSFDADFRKYLHFKRKFVWANRVTFGFSKSFGHSELERRFFLGGNENWLLYRVNLDEYERNLPHTLYSSYVVPFRGWNYFDLTGTRFAVLNTEFRFPFVREICVAWPIPFSIRYINGAFFMDVGNAWDPRDEYKKVPLPKDIYGGIGLGLRANLGIFVLRYDLAWKTDWRYYVKDSQNYVSLGAEF